MKRHQKHEDGFYHINGHKFKELEGSRAMVFHGSAYKTSGGLTKAHLMMNKHGRIVSKNKHATAKREKLLEKYGYKPTKGKFVIMRKSMRVKPKSSSKSHKSKK